MKAITVWQPWATLLACGAKKYETRSWATNYRGLIAIHAAAKTFSSVNLCELPAKNGVAIQMALNENNISLYELPYKAIIAIAELVECWQCIGADRRGDLMIFKGDGSTVDNEYLGDKELLFGDFSKGRYAWEFANMKILDEPIFAKGTQRLWNWNE